MYVKLAFAVASHLDSEIMVMDEVLAVGDVKFQKKCLGKMGDEAKDGKTVLYVSHNMATIKQLCSRCIVLDHGRVIFDGDVEKAIAIYCENDYIEKNVFYDLNDAARPSLDHGREFRIKSVRFIEKNQAVYKTSEPIKLEMEYSSTIDGQRLGAYISMRNADSLVIGTMQIGYITDVVKTDSEKVIIEMDVSNFSPGDYWFQIDCFYSNEYGTGNSCDHPLVKIGFTVIEDGSYKGFDWKAKYFGSIRLNDIKVIR